MVLLKSVSDLFFGEAIGCREFFQMRKAAALFFDVGGGRIGGILIKCLGLKFD